MLDHVELEALQKEEVFCLDLLEMLVAAGSQAGGAVAARPWPRVP
jgi:hypothetical protein